MASSGLDPVTGAPTLVLGGPANPPRYEASLKVATVIVALDKSATGLNSKNHLTKVASQHLALMANVAAIYENQLGVRLLVQELILTPDSDDYDDIPYDDNGSTLDEFQEWVQRWRPEATYGQTVAIRFGDGLSGGTIGIAYQDALHTRDGVGVMRAGFGVDLPRDGACVRLVAFARRHHERAVHHRGAIVFRGYRGAGVHGGIADLQSGPRATRRAGDDAQPGQDAVRRGRRRLGRAG